MKKITFSIIVMLACMAIATPAAAQFNLKKAVSGAAKVTKAVTLTDEQMADYVKEYIAWMTLTRSRVPTAAFEYSRR